MTKEQIIEKINQNEKLLKKSGIKKISLFGSYARNEQTEKSDIDFIWELERPRTLNSMGKAQEVLNSLFPDNKVDTVF